MCLCPRFWLDAEKGRQIAVPTICLFVLGCPTLESEYRVRVPPRHLSQKMHIAMAGTDGGGGTEYILINYGLGLCNA